MAMLYNICSVYICIYIYYIDNTQKISYWSSFIAIVIVTLH